MTNVHKIATASDADAAYVLGRIAAADKAEAEAHHHEGDAQTARERAAAARREAGQRLIEVRARMAKSGQARCPDFARWIETSGIPQSTVSVLMKAAGFTEEQREAHKEKERVRKAKERARKPKTWGWVAALTQFGDLGSMQFGGAQSKKLSARRGEDVTKLEFTTEADARAFADWATVVLRRAPEPEDKEKLSESAQAKLERIIAKEMAQLQASFWDKVNEKVSERLPEDRAKYQEGLRNYTAMCKGIAPHLLEDDYRFLLRVLHPDREPTREERERGFTIVRGLEPYMAAFRKYRQETKK